MPGADDHVREAARAPHPQRRRARAASGGPSVVTPSASPPIGSSVTRSPAPPVEARRSPPRTARTVVEPTIARSSTPAKAGSASSRRFASSWSSRSPPIAPSRIHRGRRRRRSPPAARAPCPRRPCRPGGDRSGVPAASRRSTSAGVGRVEVADEPIGPPSEPVERGGAAVGGDDQRRRRRARPRRPAPARRMRRPRPASVLHRFDPRERRTARQLGRVDRPEARRGGLHRLPSPA